MDQNMPPTTTLRCELGILTRSVKKIVLDVFINSSRKEVDERRETGGVSMWINAPLLGNNSLSSSIISLVVHSLLVNTRETART